MSYNICLRALHNQLILGFLFYLEDICVQKFNMPNFYTSYFMTLEIQFQKKTGKLNTEGAIIYLEGFKSLGIDYIILYGCKKVCCLLEIHFRSTYTHLGNTSVSLQCFILEQCFYHRTSFISAEVNYLSDYHCTNCYHCNLKDKSLLQFTPSDCTTNRCFFCMYRWTTLVAISVKNTETCEGPNMV